MTTGRAANAHREEAEAAHVQVRDRRHRADIRTTTQLDRLP